MITCLWVNRRWERRLCGGGGFLSQTKELFLWGESYDVERGVDRIESGVRNLEALLLSMEREQTWWTLSLPSETLGGFGEGWEITDSGEANGE